MPNNSVVMEDEAAAPVLTPEMMSKIKKEDMKQAVVERFRGRTEAAAPRTAVRTGKRSPHWQPADDQC
ncbi:MAG: hypothetical protein ACLPPV_07885 [Candidatus Korobacteraceae bacterium]|jgi:hypothetical protein